MVGGLGRLDLAYAEKWITRQIYFVVCKPPALFVGNGKRFAVMETIKFILMIIPLIVFHAPIYSNCNDAYRREIASGGMNRKMEYRAMLSILEKQNPKSKHLEKLKKLLHKNGSLMDLPNEDLLLALNLFNLANAFCEDEKPMKITVVAKWLPDSLIRLNELLDQVSEELLQAKGSLVRLLKLHRKIKKTTDIEQGFELFKTSVSLLAMHDFALIKSKIATIEAGQQLLARLKLRPEMDNGQSETINRLSELINENFHAQRHAVINHLRTVNRASIADRRPYALFSVLLKISDQLDRETINYLETMKPVQLRSLSRLLSIKHPDPWPLAEKISNKWSLQALLHFADFRAFNKDLEKSISGIGSEAQLQDFISSFTPSLMMAQRKNAGIPAELLPMVEIEKHLVGTGFVVAYHTIPDTSYSSALTLYEFNAVLANIIYGIELDVLPRFRKDAFSLWHDVDSLLHSYEDDHSDTWRRIGIAGSLTVMSDTESPPFRDFAAGYKSSGAPKPDAIELISNQLMDLNFSSELANACAIAIAQMGNDVFNNVGGSILQIGIRADLAQEYMFLCKGAHGISCWGENMLRSLILGQYPTTEQIRVIMHPKIFLDPKQAILNHYPYNQNQYSAAKIAFRQFVDQELRPTIRGCLEDKTCREQLLQNLIVEEIALF